MSNVLGRKKIIMVVLSVALTCISSPLSGIAAIANVTVADDSFKPATTNINAGDTVVWTWAATSSNNHNVVSTSSPFAWLFPNVGGTSANQNNTNTKAEPFVFTNTFNSAGSFPYKCTVHGNHGMVGTINVTAVNVRPSVAITNPQPGTVLSAPADLTIQASASDSDGSVTNVQFLIGVAVLTNKSTAPFSASASNLSAGIYSLSAVASDNLGAKTTNSVSLNVITPTPLILSMPAEPSSINFQFKYSADAGLSYVVQKSTNLVSPNWTSIFTNKASANPVVFVDSNAVASPGFYRVIRLPNP